MKGPSETVSGWERRRLMPAGHWDWHIPTPFSQGWRVGPLVFIGGQLALDERGQVIAAGDIEEQTRIVFENVTTILAEAGAGWEHVVKLNTFYVFDGEPADAQEFWRKMTEIRKRFLPDPGPCGTGVRVAGLMYDGLVIEVEAIAVIDGAEVGVPIA
ncbi:MAG: RidA family protein [Actinobacteria bacterium]|nr:RidA family protein [Actinomycetota bacterium]